MNHEHELQELTREVAADLLLSPETARYIALRMYDNLLRFIAEWDRDAEMGVKVEVAA
jgi:hypothetical protein